MTRGTDSYLIEKLAEQVRDLEAENKRLRDEVKALRAERSALKTGRAG